MKHLYFQRIVKLLLFIVIWGSPISPSLRAQSAARIWNEALLESIRHDLARPTVHARNLFHVSIAMYDAWAAYDTVASPFLLGQTVGNYHCPFLGIPQPTDIEAARHKTLSYACYRLLKQRFQSSPGATTSLALYDSLMNQFGYATGNFSEDYGSGDAAALGNYIAARIMEFGFQDGSNQQNGYANQYYTSLNPPLVVNHPGNTTMIDLNRYQPLQLDQFIDQSGNVYNISPPFLSPEWGNVTPFSMHPDSATLHQRDGDTYRVYHDPGMPPQIDTSVVSDLESMYKWGFLMVSIWQSHLDTADGVMWDISPASLGNNTALPNAFEEYPNFYRFIEGGDQSQGYPTNPSTGQPYTPQWVRRGDYARVLAEFWADGPNSETPPGHWFSILNYVSDHPEFEKRWQGQGPILNDLEWDVKSYLTMGGAMHDAAITAWGIKGWYDYTRPVTAIRRMAELGQSTDPMLPRFHKAGIPLVPGYSELVMPGDSLAGPNNENLYKIKLYTWRGHAYIDSPAVDMAHVGWILAENWWPYQRPSFVTPPFAGYISGHSTYSRTAAEIMTLITGSNYFPGGMSEFYAGQNTFLHFEEGPSTPIVLQWATYQDASDQCSLSRIWGGIHPPQDDIVGRHIGMELGPEAFDFANRYFIAEPAEVVQLTPSHTVWNDALCVSGFDLNLSFDKAMDENSTPNVAFNNPTLAAAIALENLTWTDAQNCVLHFSLADQNIETSFSGVWVTGARDTAGILQKPAFFNTAFVVDTRNPLITSVSCNDSLLSNPDWGGEWSVYVQFDEAMDASHPPVVQFESSVPVSIINSMTPTTVWLSSSLCQIKFPIAQQEEVCPSLDLWLSDLQDLRGNAIATTLLPTHLEIESERPVLQTALANTYTLSSETDSLEVWLSFSEAMDMQIAPILQFSGNPALGTMLQEAPDASYWINPFSYRAKYAISNISTSIPVVNLQVSAAKDPAGNPMWQANYVSWMEVVLGINPTAQPEALVSIGPNPVSTSQSLQIQNLSMQSIDVLIMSIDGRLTERLHLAPGSTYDQPVHGWSQGVYVLHLISNAGRQTHKIMVAP